MASTSGSSCEIRKFDGKNFALWKEMMQDVLVQRRQIEAIRHFKTPAGKTPKGMEVRRRTGPINDLDASGGKRLLQYYKGEKGI